MADPQLPMALVTITTEGEKPSLDEAAAQLHVAVEDIDKVFGFVAIDAATNSYAVRVRADRLPMNFPAKEPFQGPFADPPIAAFGAKNKKPGD